MPQNSFDQFVEQISPDFLCLQEVKLNPDVIPEEDFGYAFTTFHLAEKRGTPAPLYFPRLNHSRWCSICRLLHSGEGRVITCEYDGFYLVNAYVPNSKGDLSRLPYRYDSWDPAILEYLIDLQAKKPVVYCGDLNVAHQEIDLANPKTNRKNAGFTDQGARECLTFSPKALSIPSSPPSRHHRCLFLVVLPRGCKGTKCWVADRLFCHLR